MEKTFIVIPSHEVSLRGSVLGALDLKSSVPEFKSCCNLRLDSK